MCLVARAENRKLRPRRTRARSTYIYEVFACTIRNVRGRGHRFRGNFTATILEDKRETDGPVVPSPHRARTKIAEARKNE